MATPKPRPVLSVIREGNPGHAKIRHGVKLPPATLAEPDWAEPFPSGVVLVEEIRRLREVASREWRRVVPVLERTAGLGAVDAGILGDYCVCVARIDQCERGLTKGGLLYSTERGWAKNGLTTIVSSYRQQLRCYIGELGLSPSARVRLTPPGDDDGDDVFD